MPEEIHERHNRVATEMARQIAADFPDKIDRLVVLESLIVAIVAAMPFKTPRMAGANETLRVIAEGAAGRILSYYQR